MRRTRRYATLGALAVAALVVAAGCTGGTLSGRPSPSASASGSGGRPNVVFVLTDDLSTNLARYMPHVRALQNAGMSFDDYSVTDSLCCPSRSSIFTGQYPHDTGVYTNSAPDGGFRVFHAGGKEQDTFATSLRAAGYRTAMMGKYLNGYQPGGPVDGTSDYVPPGWSEWDVAGNGYGEFDYDLNENHRIVHYGHEPSDYLTDVVSRKGQDFIKASAGAKKPFLLEIATFAPHGPYTPAPRDAHRFPGLRAPRDPAWNTTPSAAPAWLAHRPALNPAKTAKIDRAFRKRVQSVRAVDKMIGDLRSTLSAAGVARNTVIVFSSDNGYHMGEYRLMPGKQTAFDTDVRVPLVAAGPGIPAGRTSNAVVSNIDLCPTFEQLGGGVTPSSVDGHSLVPMLHGGSAAHWRTMTLVEHHGPDADRTDPDLPPRGSGNPPSYQALRTATATFVRYDDGAVEYYDRTRDPDELHNVAGRLPASTLATLKAETAALHNCHGADQCWSAGHPS
ncbi:hypothetical protein Athai_45150 [Actinocatenispora thailandica]|uniref:Sulfatase N-terminal domain-containing protein n=2 Tax=Actinocatenispora thailandica TaxID=227318 RepID=A0A7R7HY73_9ACTN|nr:hypothetical protein Athai_45150 [Actinocatenispora thailandica]